MDCSPHPAVRRQKALINIPALRWFFYFMFATLIILPSASATPSNLLLNSSFEDGTYVDETSTPDNWWKGGSGWQAWKNTGGPYEGTKMVCVGSTSDSWSYFGQDVFNISAGKTYTFSAYVKTEDWGSPVGRLQVEFKDSNNSLIRADYLDVVSGINTTWAQYTLITGAAPSGTTRANFMVWGKNGSPVFDSLSARALNNTYYVRPDGNDANSGTANTAQGAWATIQHAADTADPSDTVEVEPGTYNEQVVITHSGLANQLLTFHADGEVVIDGQNTRAYGIKLDGASYIKIEGFTVRNAGSIGIFLVNNSDHNVLLNNTCYSNGSTATSALGDRPCGIYLYTSSNYNTIEGNLCRNNTSTGIWLEDSSSYCTVKGNKSYSNGYGGIIVAGATNYNAVSYNLIYSNGQLGMDVSYGAHDNTISNNTIYNNGATGISSNNYGGPNNIKNNIISNNGQNYSWAYGITMDSNSTAALSYNDVYNNGQGGTKNYLGILPGPGDIILDPLFKSTDLESADFLKLQSLANSDANESPCIDAGSPSDTPSQNSGKRIDIGAYDIYSHDPIQGGLVGEYFDNADFIGLKLTRIDPRIYFDWGSAVPDCSLAPETFSVRWQGQVKIDLAQDYTFYTSTDDGSRLWIDNQLIIDSWIVQGETEHSATVSLTPGLHDIKYEYYQDTGWAIAKLSWSAPSINKTIIPADHLYYFERLPQGQYAQGGLKGVYGKYTNLWGSSSYVLTRIDPQINFDWGGNMADYALGWDNYTAKWKGKVRIDTADTYAFYTTSDDGCPGAHFVAPKY